MQTIRFSDNVNLNSHHLAAIDYLCNRGRYLWYAIGCLLVALWFGGVEVSAQYLAIDIPNNKQIVDHPLILLPFGDNAHGRKGGEPTTSHLLCLSNQPPANNSTYSAFITSAVIATTHNVVPFWLRTNQNGSIPLDGLSGSLWVGGVKDYSASAKKIVDWGAGFEGRWNVGRTSEFLCIEAYVKGRVGPVEMRAGRFKNFMGLADTTLSSGAFSLSGNALGIPQITIGLNDYWDIPLTKRLLAVKGKLVHGWAGQYTLDKNVQEFSESPHVTTYLHQSSLYGRLGKPHWTVKLQGGFNHQTTWGSEDQIFPDWPLTVFETYKYVFTGKSYGGGDTGINASKVGNHVGSIDQSVEWDLQSIGLLFYHQFFYEAGALADLANVKDGLWGLSVANKSIGSGAVQWHKFLVEFLYSKSQGGEVDSKDRASGPEDYYNNYVYADGWRYKDENMGNNLLTARKYARKELPDEWDHPIVNNRVMAFYAGAQFQLFDWRCVGRLAYSINYGTYATSPAYKGPGGEIITNYPPYFPVVNQFLGYLEAQKPLQNNLTLQLTLAVDQGDLLYNSVGGGVSLTKRF